MEQYFFDYKLKSKFSIDDFYVSSSNENAYYYITNNNFINNNIILIGPNKSGKTHLGKIWQENHNAVIFENNFDELIEQKENIFIDNFLENIREENLFHLINHCLLNNLYILLTSNIDITEYNFLLKDLSSRLKTFNHLRIKMPDDSLIINLLNKLLHDKQIIIKNPEIFNFILKRISRTYEDIYLLVDNIDKLSLKNKKELTIPLIKDLI